MSYRYNFGVKMYVFGVKDIKKIHSKNMWWCWIIKNIIFCIFLKKFNKFFLEKWKKKLILTLFINALFHKLVTQCFYWQKVGKTEKRKLERVENLEKNELRGQTWILVWFWVVMILNLMVSRTLIWQTMISFHQSHRVESILVMYVILPYVKMTIKIFYLSIGTSVMDSVLSHQITIVQFINSNQSFTCQRHRLRELFVLAVSGSTNKSKYTTRQM